MEDLKDNLSSCHQTVSLVLLEGTPDEGCVSGTALAHPNGCMLIASQRAVRGVAWIVPVHAYCCDDDNVL